MEQRIGRPHSGAIPIDSFCVESGRWSARGAEDPKVFSSAAAALPSRTAKLAVAGALAKRPEGGDASVGGTKAWITSQFAVAMLLAVVAFLFYSFFIAVAAGMQVAILVPFPTASADHQRTNAEWMERAGAAVVVADSELSGPRLAAEVGKLVGDPSRLSAMGRASVAIARPDAAAAVAAILLAAG